MTFLLGTFQARHPQESDELGQVVVDIALETTKNLIKKKKFRMHKLKRYTSKR